MKAWVVARVDDNHAVMDADSWLEAQGVQNFLQREYKTALFVREATADDSAIVIDLRDSVVSQ